jgi:hypothetical protein
VYSERRDASKAARVCVFVFRIGGFELADVRDMRRSETLAQKAHRQECSRY